MQFLPWGRWVMGGRRVVGITKNQSSKGQMYRGGGGGGGGGCCSSILIDK